MSMLAEMSRASTHEPVMPEERKEGTFHGIMVQLNRMATNRERNSKAALLQWLIQKYEIQLVGLGEVGVNWRETKHGKRLLSLLLDIEQNARCSTAHNSRKTECHGIHQQGGVGLIVLNELIPYYSKGSKDFRSLGRWDRAIIAGSQEGHITRVVQVYRVRPELSQQLGSMCQQHWQHIRYQVSRKRIYTVSLEESSSIWIYCTRNQLRVWSMETTRWQTDSHDGRK